MSEQEYVSYENSALIVWDMQNGIASRAFNLKEIVLNTNELISAFHEKGKPVVFSQQTRLPYEFQSRYSKYMSRRRGQDPKASTHMQEASESWQILKEISQKSKEEDIVLKKYTPDFFIGTILEQLLQSKGIETVVFSGVSTEVGIEASVRHAGYIGFMPVIAEDAVGSADPDSHQKSLDVMRKLFEVRSTGEIITKLKQTG